MSLEVWLLFVATETVLCLTPGAAVATVVARSVTGGPRTGVWTSTGVLAANALYFAISATGVFAVLLAWYEVFFLVKWIGAAYLIWLGVKTWRAKPPDAAGGEPHPATVRHAVLDGFAVQISNPKTLLFFGALLPQFVEVDGSVAAQLAILGATSIAIEFAALSMYAVVGGRAAGLARCPRFANALQKLSGALLMTAAATLATLRRS